MIDFNNIYDGTFIGYGDQDDIWDLVYKASNHGLKLHNHIEYAEDFDGRTVVTRNYWYAAHPDWVAEYHYHGGHWAYRS